VHGWIGRDGTHAPERVGSVIEELDAEVVALQEVRVHDEGHAHETRSAVPLGYEVADGPTVSAGCSRYGNALLSRLPVEASRCVDLSVPGREPRGAVIARLRAPRGATLVVAGTHLGLRPRERVIQVRRLLRFIASFSRPDDAAVVLGGDLNEWWPRGRALGLVRRAFDRAPAPASFPAWKPWLALDRIFVRPRQALRRVRAHASPLSRVASDHLPVVAELLP
jgi:endonuclease/exonuclease/phosphatase family metal-dependent hydrolase